MKYYYSAPASSYSAIKDLEVKNILLSFAVDAKKYATKFNSPQNDIIIDSGAFSIFNSGKTINIDEYKDFCLSCPQNWKFINLDVIPSGNLTSQDYVNKCIEEGFENFLYLSKYIKNLMPVFHYGEDYKWLKKYRDYTDFIGIGHGGYKSDQKEKIVHYTKCFKTIGINTKVHALGYSSINGLYELPFYSFDSITYKRCDISKTVSTKYFGHGDINSLLYRNIRWWLNQEIQITNVWRERGIEWN